MPKVVGNGISVTDGSYGFAMDPDELYERVIEDLNTPDLELEYVLKKRGQKIKTAGTPDFIKLEELPSANWGVVWPPKPWRPDEQAHYEALQPLIEKRRESVRKGSKKRQVKEFEYQPGWSYIQFLEEAGPQVKPGQMRTDKIPYYLLIVGDPQRIPWSFQTNLDGEYAVGRLWFSDPDDCRAYVGSLLTYEADPSAYPRARRALLLGTLHPSDDSTRASARHLVQPLYEWLAQDEDAACLGFQYNLLLGQNPGSEATRGSFLQRMADPRPPAVWFTASHGLEWPEPNAQQESGQGALVFQDWSGGSAGKSSYLAGLHVAKEMQPAGSVAFCFACCSAGTPQMADWVRKNPFQIALRPFVARLPQKLLAGGALGFIGHVSRAWNYSILGWDQAGEQIVPFQNTMFALMMGYRLGHATDYLNNQWGELTKDLIRHYEGEVQFGREELVARWLARNDFRSYALLGDPAARLAVEHLV